MVGKGRGLGAEGGAAVKPGSLPGGPLSLNGRVPKFQSTK
jgi:hypothetical protein